MLNASLSSLFVFVGLSGPALASTPDVDTCIASAAAHHRVDAGLLRAIAKVESNLNPKAIAKNTNGTYDRGLMQINDWWIPTLSKFGITKESLFDPCVSAHVGAWILAQEIQRHGATWEAVGRYNSPTPANQIKYVQKVHRTLSAASINAPVTR